MAETTIDLSINDVALTFTDGTGTYAARLTEGTITIMQGEYDDFMSTNADGSPVTGGAPRKAGVRQMAGFTLNCSVFDVGDNATDETYQDLRTNDGHIGSTWTETSGSPDSEIACWNANIVIADRGSIKGATYAFTDVRLEGAPDLDVTRDGGWKANDTWRQKTAVKYTVTRTA